MMRLAVSEAVKSGGYVNPNPHVGAVIVKNGRIIGTGYHERYGCLHAERNALADCTEDPAGGTIYVTLEPCCHYGKTPPCTDAIIGAGLSRVVYGSSDPNPLVSGKGAAVLRDAGIVVESGLLKSECDSLNPAFFHYITNKTPFVTMKSAVTLDGKTACYTGASRWITGPEARRNVHKTRGLNTGIMVGVGTVITDDPELTCRDAEGLNPVRIVCDTHLRTPLESKLLSDTGIHGDGNRDSCNSGASESELGSDNGMRGDCGTCPSDTEPSGAQFSAGADLLVFRDSIVSDDNSRYPRTIIATSVTEPERLKPYKDKGAVIIECPEGDDGHTDLKYLMAELGKIGIDSILLEGGSELNWSALRSGIVHRVQVYIAPKIFGGKTARTPVSGTGVPDPDRAFILENVSIRKTGDDFLIEGSVSYTD